MDRFDELNRMLDNRNDEKREEILIKTLLDMIATEQEDEIHDSLMRKMMVLYSEQNEELNEKYEEIKRLSVIDPLTQIYNRLKFMEMIKYEMERFNRYHIPLSILMFDIDHFKNVNDTYGHDIGDEVLVTLTSIVSDITRKADTFARWGGEEFMILLPDCGIKEGEIRAEEIRKKIDEHYFNKVDHITCSFGVTEYLEKELVGVFTKRVDDALYESKHNGRNQVTSL